MALQVNRLMQKTLNGFRGRSLLLKGLLLGLLLISSVNTIAAASYPKPSGYVNDFAGVISSSDERAIEATAASLKKNGEIELSVVTIPSLEGESIESYSIGLAESWGVGVKGKDTGVILLLAVEDRKVRIEVGYGLEGDLPDGLVGRILDEHVIPDFKNNNFSAGLLKGSNSIAATLAAKRDFTLTQVNIDSYAVKESEDSFDIEGILFTIFIIMMVFGRRKFWPLLFLMGGGSGHSHGHGGGFGSSGRSGGFGGGGFGGFSGGSFGGGGASRGF